MTTQARPSISPGQLLDGQAAANPSLLIDVCSRRSYHKHHIEGSQNIPLPLLLNQEWPDGDWIVLADNDHEALHAIALLHDSGYERRVQWLDGGLSRWKERHLPLAGTQSSVSTNTQEPATVAAVLAGGLVLVGLQVLPLPALVLSLALVLIPVIAGRVLSQMPKNSLKHLA